MLLKAHLPEQFGDKLRVDSTIWQKHAYDLSQLTTEEKLALLAMKRHLAAQASAEEGGANG